MKDEKMNGVENKQTFDKLYSDLIDYRKSVKYSSNPRDYNNCEAFRKIVQGGKKFIPFILDKIKDGDSYLSQAMEEITGVDIFEYYKKHHKNDFKLPVDEQKVAQFWLKWWEQNKSKYENK